MKKIYQDGELVDANVVLKKIAAASDTQLPKVVDAYRAVSKGRDISEGLEGDELRAATRLQGLIQKALEHHESGLQKAEEERVARDLDRTRRLAESQAAVEHQAELIEEVRDDAPQALAESSEKASSGIGAEIVKRVLPRGWRYSPEERSLTIPKNAEITDKVKTINACLMGLDGMQEVQYEARYIIALTALNIEEVDGVSPMDAIHASGALDHTTISDGTIREWIRAARRFGPEVRANYPNVSFNTLTRVAGIKRPDEATETEWNRMIKAKLRKANEGVEMPGGGVRPHGAPWIEREIREWIDKQKGQVTAKRKLKYIVFPAQGAPMLCESIQPEAMIDLIRDGWRFIRVSGKNRQIHEKSGSDVSTTDIVAWIEDESPEGYVA